MNDFDDYATSNEVATRLSIHPESARRLIRQHKIPAVKVCRAWLVRRDVLEQYASGYDGDQRRQRGELFDFTE